MVTFYAIKSRNVVLLGHKLSILWKIRRFFVTSWTWKFGKYADGHFLSHWIKMYMYSFRSHFINFMTIFSNYFRWLKHNDCNWFFDLKSVANYFLKNSHAFWKHGRWSLFTPLDREMFVLLGCKIIDFMPNFVDFM